MRSVSCGHDALQQHGVVALDSAVSPGWFVPGQPETTARAERLSTERNGERNQVMTVCLSGTSTAISGKPARRSPGLAR
jgi:hypothetical protein